MSAIVSKDRRPAPVQSPDPQLTFGPLRNAKGPEEVQRHDPLWFLGCVSRAIDRSMPRKEAAYLVGKDPSQMNRELQGDGKFDMKLLERWPLTFWYALVNEIGTTLGVPDPQAEIERAVQDITRGISILAARATR
jgi:hypothetical protein